MRIFISKKDIKEGRATCEKCPVSRALRRRLKAIKNRDYKVEVGTDTYRINGLSRQLPPKAREFVRLYDYDRVWATPRCIDFPDH